MILEKEYNWKECKFLPLQQIHCAFDETFLLFKSDLFKSFYLIHVDKDGHVLRQQKLKEHEKFLTMISDHQVIVGEKRKIRLIDLRNKDKDKTINITVKDKQFEFSHPLKIFDTSFEMKAFIFEETKLLCIANKWQGWSKHIQEKQKWFFKTFISATYIPLASIYSETTQNKIVQEMEVDGCRYLQKVDCSSSVSARNLWQKPKKQTIFEIISAERVQKFYCPGNTFDYIQNIWRKNEDEFLLKYCLESSLYIANIAHQSIIPETLFPKGAQIQRIIFFDKFFVIKVKKYHYYLQIFNYDMKKIKSFKVKNDQAQQDEPYDGTVMMSWIRKGNKDMWVKRTKFISLEDAYMHMLLHLNEDFDDDYLLDCMRVLDQEQG